MDSDHNDLDLNIKGGRTSSSQTSLERSIDLEDVARAKRRKSARNSNLKRSSYKRGSTSGNRSSVTGSQLP